MAENWGGYFALPCGVDFAIGFVDGLMARFRNQPPEALAQVTVWLNSGRTLNPVREALAARGPLLMPSLRVVTDLGVGRGGPVEAPLSRQLQLARLIAEVIAARPDLGRGQSIPELARSLSTLMVEMQTEGRDADALNAIDPGDHARHWQAALAFLKIAAGFHLGQGAPDRPARQRHAAETLAEDWAAGADLPEAPVIVAGSTGSHGATRLFMQAVAGLPNGAVVLPGFDFDQPDSVWQALDAVSEDHPQARFSPFRETFGVRHWTTGAKAPCPERNRLVSLALRPAPVTDQWIADGPSLGDLRPATKNLSLIEADQPGEEAEAIAALIRAEVEEGRQITLIAADRGLTRRVASVLGRWRIVPDDSAGQPLPLSPTGLLMRHIAALPGQRLTPDVLLVLLKHPLALTGSTRLPRNAALLQVRDLELRLRRHGPTFPDGDALRNWGDKGNENRKIFAGWLAALLDRIGPWATDRALRPVAERLRDVVIVAETLAAGPDGSVEASELWDGDAGALAGGVLDLIATHADKAPPMSAGDFADLLYAELQGQALRRDPAAHPLVLFRGPREARTAGHGTVILAGLNEGSWPQALSPDPWLSRPMRQAAGLPLPERQIGLAAHDFQQAIGAERVILTRARRDAEAETIPSRWLNRLVNLLDGLPDQGGKEALEAMRARGCHWLDIAHVVAKPRMKLDRAPRPAPIPPAPAFAQLSVTEIARLIRDPYAIYARRVLGLQPLDPLRAEPDAAERGQVLHRIVERMLKDGLDASLSSDDLRDRLLKASREVMATEVPWPSACAFWQARMEGIARQIAQDEHDRLQEGEPVQIEDRGALALDLPGGASFTLTARADRIDRLRDGRAHVYDYKSGTPPTPKQMDHFDKQLPLQAVMVERGAFPDIGPTEVAGVSYIQLGGEGKTKPRAISPDMLDETWTRFGALIEAYLLGGAGFVARRALMLRSDRSDYDHLSRFGEWDLSDDPDRRKVGVHG
ncbi:double-strand break repair protein AddB [Paracoccus sp. TK19116]|uniref:Double-strand break repair protein AddB n=1 Tax=Paracoccus albicereus TaxID=2922394 RepID=A0ABT1MTR7_9RHOB|nr:double-strand break repair protein AddB [Paracoccus albicereus]MCQ0971089.1 double-strand break repair protein AddB [Paracoccus albicereus]